MIRNYLIVLNFHEINEKPINKYAVSHRFFQQLLSDLKRTTHFAKIIPEDSFPFSTGLLLTFDDGYASQFSILEVLKKFDIQALFFINPYNVGKPGFLSLDQLLQIEKDGHLICNHGYSHTDLSKLSSDNQHLEIFSASDFIKRHFKKSKSNWLAAPFGRINNDLKNIGISNDLLLFSTDRLPNKQNEKKHPIVHRYNITSQATASQIIKWQKGDLIEQNKNRVRVFSKKIFEKINFK